MSMIDPIVHSANPVTLIGAGEVTPPDLQKSLSLAPICVAADGGAALALAEGVDVAALIGDFDSVTADILSQIPPQRQHRVAEQTSTDFEKALVRIKAPLVLGVGFLGGRLDHQMAVLHSLVAYPERPCILIGRDEVICLAPPRIELPTQALDVVSLFPMAPVSGKSTGLEWPIEGLAFSPSRRIGTSNRATGPSTLSFEKPEMLLMLPRRLMRPLAERLSSQDAVRWPARA